MNSFVENMLYSLSASFITDIFLFVMTFILLLTIYFYYKNQYISFTNYSPTLLTSLGILGTFIGISIGLVHFDTNNIDTSIADLLAGMKTAFITSLIGMTYSIIINIVKGLVKSKQNTLESYNESYIAAENLDTLKQILYMFDIKNNDSITCILKNIKDDIHNNMNSSKELAAANNEILGEIKNITVEENRNLTTLHNMLENLYSNMSSFTNKLDDVYTILPKYETLLTNIQENMMKINSDILSLNETNYKKFNDFVELYDEKTNKVLETVNNQANGIIETYKDTNIEFVNKMQEYHEYFNEFSKILWDKIDNFTEILSKSATEAIIEALRDVIRDFNKNITDQFGDNFKELNSAVFKLVEWQENYKEQLSEMKKQYDTSVEAISSIETSLNTAAQSSKEIPTNMALMEDILSINKKQLDELGEHLQAFAEIKDKAVSALPSIAEYIEQMKLQINDTISKLSGIYNEYVQNINSLQEKVFSDVKQISDNISNETKVLSDGYQTYMTNSEKLQNNFAKGIEQTIATIDKHIDVSKEKYDKFIKDNEIIHETAKKSFIDMSEKLQNVVGTVFEEQNKNMHKVFADMDNVLKSQVEKTSNVVNEQLAAIDRSMEQEIERVMNSMGKALGAISNKFVEDYTKLVTEMNRIVTAHRGK